MILEEPRGFPVPIPELLFQFSKSYNPSIVCLFMSPELEDVSRWLMQVLYDNYDRYVSSRDLSVHLEVDETQVLEGLNHLIESDLVESQNSGYRLSGKGYSVAYQRVTSFCPHL
jgi:predicted transcriptional regulator